MIKSADLRAFAIVIAGIVAAGFLMASMSDVAFIAKATDGYGK
tara:strand:- start:501 stop:629 length:129 start_codon:yes stop_codon:yes gene_type:complete